METQEIDMSPAEVAAELKEGKIRLVDVRKPWEWGTARIDGARLLTRELSREMQESWPLDTPIVFY